MNDDWNTEKDLSQDLQVLQNTYRQQRNSTDDLMSGVDELGSGYH